MPFLTLKELESATTLTDQQIDQTFQRLTYLIIHGETNEARDYTHALRRLVGERLIGKPVVTPVKLEVELEPDKLEVSAYFHWSAYEEKCHICKKVIQARVPGIGIFMDKKYNKWCEECATDKHRQHPNYLKYKK